MVFDIVRYLLLGLAVLLLIGSIIMLMRSLRLRSSSRSETYNVLRLNQRRGMVNQAFGSVGLLLLALIFFVVGGVMSLGGEASGEESQGVEIPTPPSTAVVAGGAATEAPVLPEEDPTATNAAIIVTEPAVVSTAEPESPTVEPTSTVPATATPVPAVVNSPVVGLYLRTAPGGDIIERLEDQVEVALQGEERSDAGLTWVLVTAPSGNQGWVAIDFLLVGQTAEDVAAAATETPTPEGDGDG